MISTLVEEGADLSAAFPSRTSEKILATGFVRLLSACKGVDLSNLLDKYVVHLALPFVLTPSFHSRIFDQPWKRAVAKHDVEYLLNPSRQYPLFMQILHHGYVELGFSPLTRLNEPFEVRFCSCCPLINA